VGILGQIWSGGVVMVAILALSVLAGSVAVERFVNFRRRDVIPDRLLRRARTLWGTGDDDALRRVLNARRSTLARVIAFMLAHRSQGAALVSRRCADIVSMDLRQHLQKAYPLAVVATLAPILGLLGTVIGMIQAFNAVASTGTLGDPALLADGISKALITTAGGLIVALPALGLHHYFRSRAAGFALQLEEQVDELVGEWFPLADADPHGGGDLRP
jgi:biopolymer transport protein ExbB